MNHALLTTIMLALLGRRHAPGKAGVRQAIEQAGTLLCRYASRTLCDAEAPMLGQWLTNWAPAALHQLTRPMEYGLQLLDADARYERCVERQWGRAYTLAGQVAGLADQHMAHPDHRVRRQARLLGLSAVHTALHGRLGLDLLDGDKASLGVSEQRQRANVLESPDTLARWKRSELRRPVQRMDQLAEQAAHLTALLGCAYGSRPEDPRPLVQRLVSVPVDEEVEHGTELVQVCEVQYAYEGPAAALRYALRGRHKAMAAEARTELAEALAARPGWLARFKEKLVGPVQATGCGAPTPAPLTGRAPTVRVMSGYEAPKLSYTSDAEQLSLASYTTWEFVGQGGGRRVLVNTNAECRAMLRAPSGTIAPERPDVGQVGDLPESYTTSRRWLEQYPELYAHATVDTEGAIPMVDHLTLNPGVPYFQGTRGGRSWVEDERTDVKRAALVAWLPAEVAEDLLDYSDGTVEGLLSEMLQELDMQDLVEELERVMSYTAAKVPDENGDNWSKSAVHMECEDLLEGLDRACGDFALVSGDTYSFGGFDRTGYMLRLALVEAIYGLARIHARLPRYGSNEAVPRAEAVDGTTADTPVPLSPKARIMKAGWEPLPKVNKRKAKLRKCRISKCWTPPEYRSPDRHMYCEACADKRLAQ